jgi:hypothetical protein
MPRRRKSRVGRIARRYGLTEANCPAPVVSPANYPKRPILEISRFLGSDPVEIVSVPMHPEYRFKERGDRWIGTQHAAYREALPDFS